MIFIGFHKFGGFFILGEVLGTVPENASTIQTTMTTRMFEFQEQQSPDPKNSRMTIQFHPDPYLTTAEPITLRLEDFTAYRFTDSEDDRAVRDYNSFQQKFRMQKSGLVSATLAQAAGRKILSEGGDL